MAKPRLRPNTPTTEHRIDVDLKPPLNLMLYESAFGTVAIYVSGDWKSRLKRTLGHLFGSATWQISGLAFCPYNPIEMSGAVTDALEVLIAKTDPKYKLN